MRKQARVSEARWWSQLVTQRPVARPLQFGIGEEKQSPAVANPLIQGDQVLGTVEALISLRRIAEKISEEGKGEVTAFLVDHNGRVLIHSEPSINVQR